MPDAHLETAAQGFIAHLNRIWVTVTCWAVFPSRDHTIRILPAKPRLRATVSISFHTTLKWTRNATLREADSFCLDIMLSCLFHLGITRLDLGCWHPILRSHFSLAQRKAPRKTLSTSAQIWSCELDCQFGSMGAFVFVGASYWYALGCNASH